MLFGCHPSPQAEDLLSAVAFAAGGFYIQTDNLAASLKQIEAAGGKTTVPPIEIPNGTFAWFSDIEGNTVGLWKPK